MYFELLILVLFCAILFKKWKTRAYPPGPFGLPLVGNILQTGLLQSRYPAVVFKELAKKYGEVFYLKIGFRDAVVFNSNESILHIMNNKKCQNRAQDMHPVILERMYNKNLGLLFGNGTEWETLRRFTVRTLRDFGFGKIVSMDSMIIDEAEKLVNFLNKEMEKNFVSDLTNLLGVSTINILWRFVTGTDYSLTDSKLHKLVKLNNAVVKSLNFGQDLATAYPFLYHWFPNWMGKHFQKRLLLKLENFIKETVDVKWRKKEYKTSSNCFLDAFLAKMDEEETLHDSVFNLEQLIICLLDMFQAGADTTSNTLSFSFLYMLTHPEIQEKVQKELDENLGGNEIITIQSKAKLPYTMATLLESARFASVTPIGITREAVKDFYYKGYLIKKVAKKMQLILNVYCPRFDESVWGDPCNLRPERFLNADGTGIDMKLVAKINQFGSGPRMCPGASLAENVQFIYFASILKKFKVEKVNKTDVLSLEPQLGVAYSPQPYKIRFIPRQSKI